MREKTSQGERDAEIGNRVLACFKFMLYLDVLKK
jgi:hypothetical protein